MTVTAKPIIAAKYAENAQTTQYTAINCRTTIDKFTATNVSAANVNFSVNIVTSGGSAGTTNLVMKTRAIAPGECYTCPELVGHSLEPSGFISTLSSAASAIVIRASGREIT
jgi:hypothetical protein